MNKKVFVGLFVFIGCWQSAVFGQSSNPNSDATRQQNVIDADYENRRSELNRQNENYNSQRAAAQQSARRRRVVVLSAEPFSKEVMEKIKTAITPRQEDLVAYQEFLRQPKTGLFRLLPNFDCNQTRVIRVGGECENALPIGEFYSFRRKTYTDTRSFDITFKDDSLVSRSQLAQTLLVKLGDVRLEDVTLASDGVKFLDEFVPQTENKAVKAQYAEISKGIDRNGYRYAEGEKAFLNKTYALRVVAYRLGEKALRRLGNFFAIAGSRLGLIGKYDRRDDLIVAFRIVRQDADGGLSILWKELRRSEAPEITFEKKEPVKDFKE